MICPIPKRPLHRCEVNDDRLLPGEFAHELDHI
jgi:hypothetical protein